MVRESAADDALIAQALKALAARMTGEGLPLGSPNRLVAHAFLEIGDEPSEIKLGYWLSSDNRLIGFDRIAYGGETSVSYSARRVARLAAMRGAAGCILIHNHPNGNPEPSGADLIAADRMDHYLSNIDVLVLGHFVLGGTVATNIRSGRALDLVPATDYTGARCPNCKHRLEDPEP